MLTAYAADFFDRLEDARGTVSVPMVVGVVIWLIMYIWQARLVAKGKVCTGGKKRMEKAIREGRVVKAQKVSCRRVEGKNGGVARFYCAYTYEVNGKTYRKAVSFQTVDHPDVLTLYYDRHPWLAKTESQMIGILPSVWPLLSSVTVAGIVISVLVYMGF